MTPTHQLNAASSSSEPVSIEEQIATSLNPNRFSTAVVEIQKRFTMKNLPVYRDSWKEIYYSISLQFIALAANVYKPLGSIAASLKEKMQDPEVDGPARPLVGLRKLNINFRRTIHNIYSNYLNHFSSIGPAFESAEEEHKTAAKNLKAANVRLMGSETDGLDTVFKNNTVRDFVGLFLISLVVDTLINLTFMEEVGDRRTAIGVVLAICALFSYAAIQSAVGLRLWFAYLQHRNEYRALYPDGYKLEDGRMVRVQAPSILTTVLMLFSAVILIVGNIALYRFRLSHTEGLDYNQVLLGAWAFIAALVTVFMVKIFTGAQHESWILRMYHSVKSTADSAKRNYEAAKQAFDDLREQRIILEQEAVHEYRTGVERLRTSPESEAEEFLTQRSLFLGHYPTCKALVDRLRYEYLRLCNGVTGLVCRKQNLPLPTFEESQQATIIALLTDNLPDLAEAEQFVAQLREFKYQPSNLDGFDEEVLDPDTVMNEVCASFAPAQPVAPVIQEDNPENYNLDALDKESPLDLLDLSANVNVIKDPNAPAVSEELVLDLKEF
jgi:hypothetical protein